MQITIQLFREVAAQAEDRRLSDWRTDPIRRLIARLALRPGTPVSRPRLLLDVWPGESSVPGNRLAVCLYQARGLLDDWLPGASAILRSDRRRVWLDAALCASDHARFAELIQKPPGPDGLALWRMEVIRIAEGGLMPEIRADWAEPHRAAARAALASALLGQAEARLLSGDRIGAEAWIGRALTRDEIDLGEALTMVRAWAVGLGSERVKAEALALVDRIDPRPAWGQGRLCVVLISSEPLPEHPWTEAAKGPGRNCWLFASPARAIQAAEAWQQARAEARVWIEAAWIDGPDLPARLEEGVRASPGGRVGQGPALAAILDAQAAPK